MSTGREDGIGGDGVHADGGDDLYPSRAPLVGSGTLSLGATSRSARTSVSSRMSAASTKSKLEETDYMALVYENAAEYQPMIIEFRAQDRNRRLAGVMMICAVLSVVVMIAGLELEQDPNVPTWVPELFRGIISLLTVVLVTCVFLTHTNELRRLRERNPMLERHRVYHQPFLLPMVMEAVVYLVHVPPGTTAHLDPALNLLVLLRGGVALRFVKEFSPVLGSGAKLVGVMAQVKPTWGLTMRVLIVKTPVRTIFGGVMLLATLLAYISFVFERRVVGWDGSYEQMVWMILLAMSAVGYGDVTPLTVPGRLATMLAAAIGLFSTALLAAVMYNWLSLGRNQEEVVRFLTRHHQSITRKELAAKAIRISYDIYKLRKQYGHDSWLAEKRIEALKRKRSEVLDTFRRVRRAFNNDPDPLAVTNLTCYAELETATEMVTHLEEKYNDLEAIITGKKAAADEREAEQRRLVRKRSMNIRRRSLMPMSRSQNPSREPSPRGFLAGGGGGGALVAPELMISTSLDGSASVGDASAAASPVPARALFSDVAEALPVVGEGSSVFGSTAGDDGGGALGDVEMLPLPGRVVYHHGGGHGEDSYDDAADDGGAGWHEDDDSGNVVTLSLPGAPSQNGQAHPTSSNHANASHAAAAAAAAATTSTDAEQTSIDEVERIMHSALLALDTLSTSMTARLDKLESELTRIKAGKEE